MFWVFSQNLSKLLVKEFIFGNTVGTRSTVLLKENYFLDISEGFCIDSVGKIIELLV